MKNHKTNCSRQKITSMKISKGPYIYWKNHFNQNPLYSRFIAAFEADNEIGDIKVVGNKTTNIYKQNPVLNGYYFISEIENNLKSGCYDSTFGYNNVDRFVNEVLKKENRLSFYFTNTRKDIITTQEDKEDFEKNNICRFCEKEIVSDKVRYHCHLTGKHRGPAHNTCNNNVTQKQSYFIPFGFHNFSNYDCHLFFKKLVHLKKVK